MATATPIAERLTFEWSPDDAGRFRLVVTDHHPRKPRTTDYTVEEQSRTETGRTFTLAKDNGTGEPYTVFVGVGRWSCTCPGSSYRNHEIQCRHVLAVRAGFGVVFV